MRAAALNLVTAAIILFNCRYLDRAVGELRKRGMTLDPELLRGVPLPLTIASRQHGRLARHDSLARHDMAFGITLDQADDVGNRKR